MGHMSHLPHQGRDWCHDTGVTGASSASPTPKLSVSRGFKAVGPQFLISHLLCAWLRNALRWAFCCACSLLFVG